MLLRLLKCVTQEIWQNPRDKLRLASPERIVDHPEVILRPPARARSCLR